MRQDIHVALLLECAVLVDHTLYAQTIASAVQITNEDVAARHAIHYPQEGQDDSPVSQRSQQKRDYGVECAWTNRLVGLTCRVINFCFASATQSTPDWTTLLSELESWNIGKPESFRPFFELPPASDKGRPFPKICLQNDWHGMWFLIVAANWISTDVVVLAFSPRSHVLSLVNDTLEKQPTRQEM